MTPKLVLAAAALFISASAAPRPAQAQAQVSADIHIGTPPARRVVVVRERPRTRVLVVERRHGRGWYKHHGFRQVRAYYYRGRFYDRWDGPRRPGLRVVVLYQRGDRYYRDWNEHYDRYDRDDYDHERRDRDDRRWDDRGDYFDGR